MPENKLKCKCGETLEDGVFFILYCPKCGVDWKIPEGQENNKRYFFEIKTEGKENETR